MFVVLMSLDFQFLLYAASFTAFLPWLFYILDQFQIYLNPAKPHSQTPITIYQHTPIQHPPYAQRIHYYNFTVRMLNPFEQSSQVSLDHFDSSMPICFEEGVFKTKAFNQSELSSPIAIVDLDRLSQRVSNAEAGENELRQSMQQLQQTVRQLKRYSESLEQRNCEVVVDLQRERMKNKQLLSALTFVKRGEEERNNTLQAKISQNSQLANQHMLQRNHRSVLQNQAQTLKLQNTYLKELILIANNNYQQLQQTNQQLLAQCTHLQEERAKRELDMLHKTQEINSIFTAIVVEKHQADKVPKKDQPFNTTASINLNTHKSVKKQPVEDAYRTLFMKTLKPRNRA